VISRDSKRGGVGGDDFKPDSRYSRGRKGVKKLKASEKKSSKYAWG